MLALTLTKYDLISRHTFYVREIIPTSVNCLGHPDSEGRIRVHNNLSKTPKALT